MGLLNKLFKKNKDKDIVKELHIAEQKDDNEEFISTSCEQIVDATYQMEDLRLEYEMVTSYLTDIQAIEQMPGTYRRELDDIARKIHFLEASRMEFLQSETRLSDERFKSIQQNEKEIPDLMKKLLDLEQQASMIKRDMEHLEGEKGSLEYQEEMLIEKQAGLRSGIFTVAAMWLITFLLFVFVKAVYQVDTDILSMIALFLVAAISAGMFFKYRDYTYERKLCQKKMNRAINLLNKVKIKYINNTSTLEYLYEKYKINSLRELEYIWDQYNLMLVEAKKYQQNTGDLKVYCDEMVKLLHGSGVKDPFVWSKQTGALLDAREMVEVKHSLNTRRQKLREQLAYNEELKNDSMKQIQQLIAAQPELKDYVKNTLSVYHIEI